MRGVRIIRRAGHVAIGLRAVHSARLRVRVTMAGRRARTVVSRRISPCHSYRIALPRGHGRVAVTASVAQGKQVTVRHY